jgi:dihydrolipoamide dehydrogenase
LSSPVDIITTDVVVIGSGPGGYHAAIRLGQLGKKTLLIEKERIGGVCLNVGCIPSKAIISASKIVKNARSASKMGIESQISINLVRLQDWKQGVVNRLTSGVESLCKQNRVDILKGTAKFVSPTKLEVLQPDGKASKVVEFKHAIVATGSSSADLPNVRFDGKRILSSTEALDLREQPKKILLIGGGVIGLEIGMAYANLFGTQLIIVEILDQLLPGTDKELVNVVIRNLERLGAKINTKSKVISVSVSGDRVDVQFQTLEGMTLNETVDYVLLGVGRRPNSGNLALDKAGVEIGDKGFIKVDKQMRTNVRNIYAIGDVVSGPLLAHRAMKEGIVAAEVISGKNSAADFQAMPAAIFTDPEIAVVGLSENQARERGATTIVGKFPFVASGRALAGNDSEGFVKIIGDKESGLILGVEVVGPEASDLISEASLAIEMGATLEDMGLTIHPHPTLPEALMEASENALGKAIHIANRRQEKQE